MKQILVSAMALIALSASAHASGKGEVSLFITPDRVPWFTQLDVSDEGESLNGIGGADVTLMTQRGGYQGFALGRAFDLTCDASSCQDDGATQAQFTVTHVAGGYQLEGSLNFVHVQATVTDSVISLSTGGFDSNVSFELNKTESGAYEGDGVFGGADSFHATLTTTGSLEGLKDPATFIVLLVNPFVHR